MMDAIGESMRVAVVSCDRTAITTTEFVFGSEHGQHCRVGGFTKLLPAGI